MDLLNKKTDYNVATTELEIKITSISGSATNSALNAIENEIPNVSNLVKKEKKKQIMTQKLVKLKQNLLIIIIINILPLQNLTILQHKFLLQD